jgi:dolichol-phosphate mannosyltransferase
MKTAVIIPTYNEAKNIGGVADKICNYLKKYDFTLLVVDDNSPDKTWEIVKNYSKKNKRIKLLKRERKLGLASAVIDGFKKVDADIYIVADADFSHDYSIMPKMIENIKKGHEIVIGSRFISGGGTKGWPFYRIIISKIGAIISKLFLKIKIKDPMSGYFAIKKDIFEKIKKELDPKGYKILLEILARSKSKKVKEIPFVFKDRIYGKSKLSGKIIKEYIRMVFTLTRV